MSDAAVKMRLKEVLNESVMQKLQPKLQQPKTAAPVAAPTDNAIYKIAFDRALSPQAQAESIDKYMYDPSISQAEGRARFKEYSAFRAWLQEVREQMSREMMQLSDTGTTGTVRGVIDEMTNGVLDYEEMLKPLTDITDALYTLRTNSDGVDITHIISQIRVDEKAEKQAKLDQDARDRKIVEIESRMNNLRADSAVQADKRAIFGKFGGVPASAQTQIARNNTELDRCISDLQNIKAEQAVVAAAKAPEKFAAEKETIRKQLLDLSNDQHKERNEKFVKCAIDYLDRSKRNVGEVKTHLEAAREQAEKLFDNSGKMTKIYATLNEGIGKALVRGSDDRKSLAANIKPDEGAIEAAERNDKALVLDDYLTKLHVAVKDTTEDVGEMMTTQVRVKGQRDAAEDSLTTIDNIYTRGISGVAERLVSTVLAVNQASLGEATDAAKATMRRISNDSDKTMQQESIRRAMGVQDQVKDLEEAYNTLQSFTHVQTVSNEFAREGFAAIRANLEKMNAASKQTEDALRESYAASSGGGAATATPEPVMAKVDSPFA